MEKQNIKTVDIEDFKNSQHVLDYVDDDFAIVNSLDGIPYSEDTVRLGCFLIAVCIEGCIQLDINCRTYKLQAGDLLLGLPNTIINHMLLSPKHKIRLAGFSTRFLQRIIKMEKDIWDTAIHIHNNPVKSIGEDRDSPIFAFYRDLIVAKINDEPHCYHREVIQHIFAALFCEMLGQLNKEIASSDTPIRPREGIKQSDYILRKFMELLSKDNGMHRSVTYFADALCYTPKHFSKVIKQACGRNPLDLINETTIEHIKYRLKRSDKSIKEIAEEFNFPNQSFFGKYVKTHLGTSPINYRNAKEE
ncbi:MAG: AraC family transcriptional regulator [Bacteroides oleiciplenus]|nr:AraC family transcriptional regulator [Bacteroides oleiciplenus]